MHPSIEIRLRATFFGLVLAAGSALLCGQTPATQSPAQGSDTKATSVSSSTSAEESDTKKPPRRFSYGARFRWWTAQPFDGKGIEVGDSQTDISHAYDTTSASGRYAVGPAVDWNVTRHLSIRAEAFFEHLEYTKVTQVYTGTPTDGTLNNTFTEHTSIGYWDFPLLVRYQGIPVQTTTSSSSTNSGPKIPFSFDRIISHAFVEAGGIVRELTTIRTGNDTLHADNSTAYNEIPATAAHPTVEGAVVGVDFRFRDDFNLKVMPEARYILWSGPTFESQSTLSRTRQIEVGLSIMF